MRWSITICALLSVAGSSPALEQDYHFRSGSELDSMHLDLGAHDDFEAVIEVKTTGGYAGLLFRGHQAADFEPDTTCGEWLIDGLYGQAVVVRPDYSVQFVSVDGHSKALNTVKGPIAPDDDGWFRLEITARGEVITVGLGDGSSFTAGAKHFLCGDLYWVSGGGESASEMRLVDFKPLEREGDWRPLFNGEDFDGWKQWGSERWDIEDGVIIGRSGPDKSEGYLATTETWKDFRVRGSFKMLGEGNFGLFYHATIKMGDKDGKPYPFISGVQGEVEPGYPSSTGWLYESYKRGWLVKPPKNTLAAYALRPDDWNEIEIRSHDSVVTTWVNGVRALHFEDPEPQLFEGSFALQLHAGGVDGIAWKDLMVLE